mgnify:CR=1 FL=1
MSIMTEIDWFDVVTALKGQFWVSVLTSSSSEAGPAKNLNFGTLKIFSWNATTDHISSFSFTQSAKFLRTRAKSEDMFFFKKWVFVLTHFWPFWANFRIFWPFLAKLLKNVPNLTISLQKSRKKLEKLSRNQKRQIWPPKCPKTYPEPKMAPKTVEGGQIWLKCITGDLIMMIRDKNNIFERVQNFHADSAWNYPGNNVSENFITMRLILFSIGNCIRVHCKKSV